MNNKMMKALIFIIMIIYVVSPTDFLPGPVDDLIMVLFSMAAQKKNWFPEKV